MAESLTSAAWMLIDERLRLQERLAAGEAIYLDAAEIKSICQREPRLMTKFDTRESRPAVLANATVLPVTNGRYVILAGDGYYSLENFAETKRWPLPSRAAALQTLPWRIGPSSESQALDMALAAGILSDFLGEERLHLTVRGRRRTPRFQFDFFAARVERLVADGVQVEVDSGLEGEGIHLVEGKLGVRNDFHVRQIYYPLRMWREEVPTKNATAIFMTWSNRCFALHRFEFMPLDNYHAIRLAAIANYVLDEDDETPSLASLLERTPSGTLPAGVPFPQADDMRRVIDVVDAVGKGCRTREQIAVLYDFDKRQSGYYGNAASFLGLLQARRGEFELSDAGSRFLVNPIGWRNAQIVGRLAALPVMRNALAWVVERADLPSLDTVCEWIKSSTKLTGTTPLRRAVTVLSWTRWAADVTSAPLSREAIYGES